MKFVNTNPHRIEVVDEDGQNHRQAAGAEFEATGKLADQYEGTNGVYRESSDEVAAWRSGERIAAVAGSGSNAQAVANAFDPGELDVDDAKVAIHRVVDADVLAAVIASERAGKDRSGVLAAADSRVSDLGIDLDDRVKLAVKQAAATTELHSEGALPDAGTAAVLPSAEVGGSTGTLTSDKVAVKGKSQTKAKPVAKRKAPAKKPPAKRKG